MRILYITPYVPSLIRIRPYNFIKGLAALGHEVTLLALAPGDEAKEVPGVRPYCHEVEIVPLTSYRGTGNMLGGIFGFMPLQVAYGRVREMEELIRRYLGRGDFDLAHVEHLRASSFGRVIGQALRSPAGSWPGWIWLGPRGTRGNLAGYMTRYCSLRRRTEQPWRTSWPGGAWVTVLGRWLCCPTASI